MDQDQTELITLHKKNEIIRGYLNEVVCYIDLENPEISLGVALGRKGVGTQLDPFLEACQQWCDSFEEKGVQIIEGSLTLLHHI